MGWPAGRDARDAVVAAAARGTPKHRNGAQGRTESINHLINYALLDCG